MAVGGIAATPLPSEKDDDLLPRRRVPATRPLHPAGLVVGVPGLGGVFGPSRGSLYALRPAFLLCPCEKGFGEEDDVGSGEVDPPLVLLDAHGIVLKAHLNGVVLLCLADQFRADFHHAASFCSAAARRIGRKPSSSLIAPSAVLD